jgi:adenylate kinase
VKDDLTIGLVRERLGEKDAVTGFILDGFPRTIPQAEALSTIRTVDAAVNFEVGDDAVVKRLSGRRVCRSCGYSPHIVYMPPKKEGICDKCGGELYTRDDDRIEAITHRLEVYRSQTAPLIDYYRKKGILVDIDGSPASTVVLAAFFAKFPPIKR